MSNPSRELLDAITAYQTARAAEGIVRSTPPETSADEYADQAMQALTELIDSRIAMNAGPAASDYNEKQAQLGAS